MEEKSQGVKEARLRRSMKRGLKSALDPFVELLFALKSAERG